MSLDCHSLSCVSEEFGLPDIVHPWDLEARSFRDTIGLNPLDLVVSCRKGLYAGNFFYINRNHHGDVVGSDCNSADITIAVKHAGLSARHALFKYSHQQSVYTVRDLDSASGTWVGLRNDRGKELLPGSCIDLNGTLLEVVQGEHLTDGPVAVEEFLKVSSIFVLRDLLSLSVDLPGCTHKFEKLFEPNFLAVEHLTLLIIALTDLPIHFLPLQTKSRSLLLIDKLKPGQVVAEIRWSGCHLCPSLKSVGAVKLPLSETPDIISEQQCTTTTSHCQPPPLSRGGRGHTTKRLDDISKEPSGEYSKVECCKEEIEEKKHNIYTTEKPVESLDIAIKRNGLIESSSARFAGMEKHRVMKNHEIQTSQLDDSNLRLSSLSSKHPNSFQNKKKLLLKTELQLKTINGEAGTFAKATLTHRLTQAFKTYAVQSENCLAKNAKLPSYPYQKKLNFSIVAAMALEYSRSRNYCLKVKMNSHNSTSYSHRLPAMSEASITEAFLKTGDLACNDLSANNDTLKYFENDFDYDSISDVCSNGSTTAMRDLSTIIAFQLGGLMHSEVRQNCVKYKRSKASENAELQISYQNSRSVLNVISSGYISTIAYILTFKFSEVKKSLCNPEGQVPFKAKSQDKQRLKHCDTSNSVPVRVDGQRGLQHCGRGTTISEQRNQRLRRLSQSYVFSMRITSHRTCGSFGLKAALYHAPKDADPLLFLGIFVEWHMSKKFHDAIVTDLNVSQKPASVINAAQAFIGSFKVIPSFNFGLLRQMLVGDSSIESAVEAEMRLLQLKKSKSILISFAFQIELKYWLLICSDLLSKYKLFQLQSSANNLETEFSEALRHLTVLEVAWLFVKIISESLRRFSRTVAAAQRAVKMNDKGFEHNEILMPPALGKKRLTTKTRRAIRFQASMIKFLRKKVEFGLNVARTAVIDAARAKFLWTNQTFDSSVIYDSYASIDITSILKIDDLIKLLEVYTSITATTADAKFIGCQNTHEFCSARLNKPRRNTKLTRNPMLIFDNQTELEMRLSFDTLKMSILMLVAVLVLNSNSDCLEIDCLGHLSLYKDPAPREKEYQSRDPAEYRPSKAAISRVYISTNDYSAFRKTQESTTQLRKFRFREFCLRAYVYSSMKFQKSERHEKKMTKFVSEVTSCYNFANFLLLNVQMNGVKRSKLENHHWLTILDPRFLCRKWADFFISSEHYKAAAISGVLVARRKNDLCRTPSFEMSLSTFKKMRIDAYSRGNIDPKRRLIVFHLLGIDDVILQYQSNRETATIDGIVLEFQLFRLNSLETQFVLFNLFDFRLSLPRICTQAEALDSIMYPPESNPSASSRMNFSPHFAFLEFKPANLEESCVKVSFLDTATSPISHAASTFLLLKSHISFVKVLEVYSNSFSNENSDDRSYLNLKAARNERKELHGIVTQAYFKNIRKFLKSLRYIKHSAYMRASHEILNQTTLTHALNQTLFKERKILNESAEWFTCSAYKSVNMKCAIPNRSLRLLGVSPDAQTVIPEVLLTLVNHEARSECWYSFWRLHRQNLLQVTRRVSLSLSSSTCREPPQCNFNAFIFPIALICKITPASEMKRHIKKLSRIFWTKTKISNKEQWYRDLACVYRNEIFVEIQIPMDDNNNVNLCRNVKTKKYGYHSICNEMNYSLNLKHLSCIIRTNLALCRFIEFLNFILESDSLGRQILAGIQIDKVCKFSEQDTVLIQISFWLNSIKEGRLPKFFSSAPNLRRISQFVVADKMFAYFQSCLVYSVKILVLEQKTGFQPLLDAMIESLRRISRPVACLKTCYVDLKIHFVMSLYFIDCNPAKRLNLRRTCRSATRGSQVTVTPLRCEVLTVINTYNNNSNRQAFERDRMTKLKSKTQAYVDSTYAGLRSISVSKFCFRLRREFGVTRIRKYLSLILISHPIKNLNMWLLTDSYNHSLLAATRRATPALDFQFRSEESLSRNTTKLCTKTSSRKRTSRRCVKSQQNALWNFSGYISTENRGRCVDSFLCKLQISNFSNSPLWLKGTLFKRLKRQIRVSFDIPQNVNYIKTSANGSFSICFYRKHTHSFCEGIGLPKFSQESLPYSDSILDEYDIFRAHTMSHRIYPMRQVPNLLRDQNFTTIQVRRVIYALCYSVLRRTTRSREKKMESLRFCRAFLSASQLVSYNSHTEIETSRARSELPLIAMTIPRELELCYSAWIFRIYTGLFFPQLAETLAKPDYERNFRVCCNFTAKNSSLPFSIAEASMLQCCKIIDYSPVFDCGNSQRTYSFIKLKEENLSLLFYTKRFLLNVSGYKPRDLDDVSYSSLGLPDFPCSLWLTEVDERARLGCKNTSEKVDVRSSRKKTERLSQSFSSAYTLDCNFLSSPSCKGVSLILGYPMSGVVGTGIKSVRGKDISYASGICNKHWASNFLALPRRNFCKWRGSCAAKHAGIAIDQSDLQANVHDKRGLETWAISYCQIEHIHEQDSYMIRSSPQDRDGSVMIALPKMRTSLVPRFIVVFGSQAEFAITIGQHLNQSRDDQIYVKSVSVQQHNNPRNQSKSNITENAGGIYEVLLRSQFFFQLSFNREGFSTRYPPDLPDFELPLAFGPRKVNIEYSHSAALPVKIKSKSNYQFELHQEQNLSTTYMTTTYNDERVQSSLPRQLQSRAQSVIICSTHAASHVLSLISDTMQHAGLCHLPLVQIPSERRTKRNNGLLRLPRPLHSKLITEITGLSPGRYLQLPASKFAELIMQWSAEQAHFMPVETRLNITEDTLSGSTVKHHFRIRMSSTKRIYDICVPNRSLMPSQATNRALVAADNVKNIYNAEFCPSILPSDDLNTPLPPMGLTLRDIPLALPSLMQHGTGSYEFVGGLAGTLFRHFTRSSLTFVERRRYIDILSSVYFDSPRLITDEIPIFFADRRSTEEQQERMQLIIRAREWLALYRDLDFFERIQLSLRVSAKLQPRVASSLLYCLSHSQLNALLLRDLSCYTGHPVSDKRIAEGSETVKPFRRICALPRSVGSHNNFIIRYLNGRYLLSIAEASSPYVSSKDAIFAADELMVKLVPQTENHILSPGDTIKMGDLEFSVMRYNTGIGGQKGSRDSMEDEEVVLQDLRGISRKVLCSFFAVYDGHGGRQCAEFLHSRLHRAFRQQVFHSSAFLELAVDANRVIYDSLFRAFILTDRHFLRNQQQAERVSGPGCAVAVVVVIGDWIWSANSGDARAVLCRKGVAIPLTSDHKPSRSDEAARIERSGGFVKARRVLGRLAVSRAFGDVEYKNIGSGKPPLVIADPEIRREPLTLDDEFLLVACDGLFDVFSSQEAVDFVRSHLTTMPPGQQGPEEVVQNLIREAIEIRHSRDNVTAVLVMLKRTIRA